MLKQAYKSLEGQSLGGVLLGGLACLYVIFTGDDNASLDQVLAHAESAKDLAAIYAQEAVNKGSAGMVGLGKAGVVLAFMYKMYAKFTDSRTKLKAVEIEEEQKKETRKMDLAQQVYREKAYREYPKVNTSSEKPVGTIPLEKEE
jgi:hypothetical protein